MDIDTTPERRPAAAGPAGTRRRDVLRGMAAGGAGAVLGAAGPAGGTPAAASPAGPGGTAVPRHSAGPRRTGPGVWGDQGDGTYRNPVLDADFSDPDVIRVGDDFYLVSSEFHLMGMVVLHSKDLVNWRYLGRVYDRLDISPHYDRPRPPSDPDTRYGKGSWAPVIRHHDGLFWIWFCTPTEGCFMTTARDPAGPWAPLTAVKLYAPGEHPWEDPCPLWDDDGQAYLGHSLKGAGPIIVHRMSPDGRTLLDEGTTVYTGPNAEGTKLYKRDGRYYLVIPENGVSAGDQWVLRSDSILGPYTSENGTPVLHSGNGVPGPHQGGLVDTPSGEWWFLHFQENGALGRVVWLEPAHWTADGWLRIGVDGDGDGIGEPVINHRKPDTGRAHPLTAPATGDDFTGSTLGLQWEWNHNPVDGHWSLTERPGHLRLIPAGAEADPFLAQGTLTQKLLGRTGTVTTELDTSRMADGQLAGLLHLCSTAQWVGVTRTGGVRRITASAGGTAVTGPVVRGERVWLRSTLDLDRGSHLHYSLDGVHFTRVGPALTLDFAFWKGTKAGLFTCNGTGGGGIADFAWFDYAHDGPDGGAPRYDTAPVWTCAGPVSFTGSPDSYLDAGTTACPQTSELTVAFTMTADRYGAMAPADRLPATADGRAGGWSVALDAEGGLSWVIGGAAPGTGTAVRVPGAYRPGRPVRVACTLAVGLDGVPTAAVYLDGVCRARRAGIPGTVMNTATPLRLGAPSTAYRDRPYAGALAGVRIWARALDAAEIAAVPAEAAPPWIRVADVEVRTDGPDAPADLGRAEVGDRLPVSVATDAPPPAYRYPLGTTTVTWTATDAAGGTGTAEQRVVVRRR